MMSRSLSVLLSLLVCLLLWPSGAGAVPSFARQTGKNCAACHVVFPQLTPYGRDFKLTGYVASESKGLFQFPPPLTGGGKAFYVHTDRAQPEGAAPFDASPNDNAEWKLVAYYAGKIIDNLGGFIQGTYDGLSEDFLLDATDIRYANKAVVAGKALVYGLTLNNEPSLEDVWNSTPAWTFPYSSSAIAPSPAAVPAVFGELAQQVGGAGAYLYWGNLVYVGGAAYRSARHGWTKWLGAGTDTEQVVDGYAPYWRLALQKQWGSHSLEAGTYGLIAEIFPDGRSSGPSDGFTDVALDAEYQYITDRHLVTLHSTLVRENQDRGASYLAGATANSTDTLDLFKADVSYYFRHEAVGIVGSTLAYFATAGSEDRLLYAPSPVNGSRAGKPNSSYFIIQADYLPPWQSSKFLVQYTIYDTFNGADDNYDGFGRDASDNNTLFLGLWQLF